MMKKALGILVLLFFCTVGDLFCQQFPEDYYLKPISTRENLVLVEEVILPEDLTGEEEPLPAMIEEMDGLLLIADSGCGRILRYNPSTQKFLNVEKVGLYGKKFGRIQAINVSDSGLVAVGDEKDKWTYIFDRDGNELLKTNSLHTILWNYALDDSGSLYITKPNYMTKWRMKIKETPLYDYYNSEGKLVRRVSEELLLKKYPETEITGYHPPLFFGDEVYFINNIYPLIFVFSKDGKFLREIKIADSRLIDQWADLKEKGDHHTIRYVFNWTYQSSIQYNKHIYLITNTGNNEIEILKVDLDGTIIGQWYFKNTKYPKRRTKWCTVFKLKGTIHFAVTSIREKPCVQIFTPAKSDVGE